MISWFKFSWLTIFLFPFLYLNIARSSSSEKITLPKKRSLCSMTVMPLINMKSLKISSVCCYCLKQIELFYFVLKYNQLKIANGAYNIISYKDYTNEFLQKIVEQRTACVVVGNKKTYTPIIFNFAFIKQFDI